MLPKMSTFGGLHHQHLEARRRKEYGKTYEGYIPVTFEKGIFFGIIFRV